MEEHPLKHTHTTNQPEIKLFLDQSTYAIF